MRSSLPDEYDRLASAIRQVISEGSAFVELEDSSSELDRVFLSERDLLVGIRHADATKERWIPRIISIGWTVAASNYHPYGSDNSEGLRSPPTPLSCLMKDNLAGSISYRCQKSSWSERARLISILRDIEGLQSDRYSSLKGRETRLPELPRWEFTVGFREHKPLKHKFVLHHYVPIRKGEPGTIGEMLLIGYALETKNELSELEPSHVQY